MDGACWPAQLTAWPLRDGEWGAPSGRGGTWRREQEPSLYGVAGAGKDGISEAVEGQM